MTYEKEDSYNEPLSGWLFVFCHEAMMHVAILCASIVGQTGLEFVTSQHQL